jgi:MinD-like ATPase involved in chromosome partitioning or flagellar assembly
MVLIVNKAPEIFDTEAVKQRVQNTYNCPVAAVIPHSDDMMTLASSGIFSLRFPDHPVSALYRQVTNILSS